MKKIFTLIVAISALGITSLYAQSSVVSGKVTAGDDGSSLPGVSVLIQGTGKGTITDIDGNYKISLESGSTLTFSYIGYEATRIEVGSRAVIDVVLQADTKSLDEVVVTALGIVRKKASVAYSVQELNGSDLTEAKENNIVNSLSGKVAGVQVMGAGGNIGGSSRILIRGANQIATGNQPLFIVDGMPIDNSNYASFSQQYGNGDSDLGSNKDYGNAAQDINPDDIESISVLKGPNATALYGSRGSNGVILITTKKGTSGQGLGVTYSTALSFTKAYVFPDLQNKYGGGRGGVFHAVGADGVNEVDVSRDESWGPALDGSMVRQWGGEGNVGEVRPWVAHPSNYEDFFETGVKFENHIAIAGSDDKNTYRMAYTRMKETGTIPNSELKKNTLSLRLNKKVHSKLKFNLAMDYINTQGKGRPATGAGSDNFVYNMVIWTQRQIDLERLKDYKYADGSQRQWRTSGFDRTNVRSNNPYWLVNEDVQNDERNRIIFNTGFTYDISDELSLTARVGQDWYADRREDRRAVGTRYTPFFLTDQIEFKEVNSDVILKYDTRIGDDITLLTTIGGSFYNIKRQRNTQQTSGGLATAGLYTITNSIDRPLIRDTYSEREVQGIFATASFGYKGFLYFDGSVRNDWSSALPTDNNSYAYSSLGGSFVFSELLDNDMISFGKIRFGWAQAGSTSGSYALTQAFNAGTPVGPNPTFSNSTVLKNANLKPQITTSRELGIELKLLDNRIGIDATFYNSVTKDQVYALNVSKTTGFSSKFVNAGEIENKGVELQLTGDILRSNDGINWNVTINYSKNNNKILKLLPGVESYVMAAFYTSGSSAVYLESRVGQPFSTIYATKIDRNDAGRAIINADGTYAVTDELQKIGSVLPDYNMGISNNFSYKNVSLSVLLDIQKGGTIFGRDYQTALYAGTLAPTAAGSIREDGIILDGVQADGSENTVNLDAESYFRLMRKTGGDHTVFDASYIKLREVSFGYTFPSSFVDKTPFNTLRLSFFGRNLAILKRNTPPMLDPESAGNSSGNLQGRSYGQLPSSKNFGFKLTTTF